MKQQQTLTMVESGVDSQSFKIKTGQAAFEILSNTLYSDSILAVVRELTTNAVDAIKNGGKVKVHLPNYAEPFFSVEDTGVGMTEQEIYDNYTSYFSSTKSDSNDEIGAFGLGSKSPFAYTDSFIITSRKNGIENTFYAYKSSNSPALTKLDSKSTDITGTTVSFEVNQDYYKFEEAALRVFSFLDMTNVEVNEFSFSENLEWIRQLLSKNVVTKYDWNKIPYYSYLGPYHGFVMGGVRYPLEKEALRKAINEMFPNISRHYCENILDSNYFNYTVGIGDVTITPSRESVKVDNKTVATLKGFIADYVGTSLINLYNEANASFVKIIDNIVYEDQFEKELKLLRESNEEFDKFVESRWKFCAELLSIVNNSNSTSFVLTNSYSRSVNFANLDRMIGHQYYLIKNSVIWEQTGFAITKKGNISHTTKVAIGNTKNSETSGFAFICNPEKSKEIVDLTKEYLNIDIPVINIDAQIALVKDSIKKKYSTGTVAKGGVVINGVKIGPKEINRRNTFGRWPKTDISEGNDKTHKFYMELLYTGKWDRFNFTNSKVDADFYKYPFDRLISETVEEFITDNADDIVIYAIKSGDEKSKKTLIDNGYVNIWQNADKYISTEKMLEHLEEYVSDMYCTKETIDSWLAKWIADNDNGKGTYFEGFVNNSKHYNNSSSKENLIAFNAAIENEYIGKFDIPVLTARIGELLNIIEKANEDYYNISSEAWMANQLLRDNRGNDEKYRFIFDMITKTCARP